MPFSMPFGSLAQRSEQPAHNRQVPGSNPGGSTGSRMRSCCRELFSFHTLSDETQAGSASLDGEDRYWKGGVSE